MTEIEIMNYIRETFENHPFTYSMILFSKKNREVGNFIYERTKNFDSYEKFTKRSRVYCVLNGITEFPKCKVCGKQMFRNVKGSDRGYGFPSYCSPLCESRDPEVAARANDTNVRKYGCKWSLQSENNREKSKRTMLERYGVEYAQQNAEIKRKSYETMEERYGNRFSFAVESLRNKGLRRKRSSMYDKFMRMNDIRPKFTRDEFVEFGNEIPHVWKCMRCGNEFESFVDKSWLTQGQDGAYVRCERCYPREAGSSSGEQDLLSFVRSVYGGKVSTHVRCLGNGAHKREIDILLDDLRIGIEYDGLYFHSEKFSMARNYHLMKTNDAMKLGIRMIHVFESDWMHKREIVKSRLKNMLGVHENTVYARKCKVVTLNKTETDGFMNRTHLQGACASSVNLGLSYGGKLVSVMTFGKPRYNRKYEWELLRFSNELGYHVVGGAGKLLKHFERMHDPNSLISYADRRWSVGNLYFRLGFSHVGDSRPNYWYFKGDGILESRVKFQKHRLSTLLNNFDKDRSEAENMLANGYNRIFDCGNMVFVKEYN